jgi:hypothetical protein
MVKTFSPNIAEIFGEPATSILFFSEVSSWIAVTRSDMFLYFGDERSANLEWWSDSKSKFTVKKNLRLQEQPEG